MDKELLPENEDHHFVHTSDEFEWWLTSGAPAAKAAIDSGLLTARLKPCPTKMGLLPDEAYCRVGLPILKVLRTAQSVPAATAGTPVSSFDGRRAMSGRTSDTSITIAITVIAGP